MSQPERPGSVWHQLLDARITRRSALKGSVAAGVASLLPLSLQVAQAAPAETGAAAPAASTRPPFRPIRPTTADDLVLPRGYRYNVVRVYGDEVAPGQPFGYNADYIAYLPIDYLDGGRSSTDGLLWVNHEYPNPLMQHGNLTGPKTVEQIAIERTSVGGSIFRVQRDRAGRWNFVQDSHNRRITGFTPSRLTGAIAGSAFAKGAVDVIGSVGNCSGGLTPWGTVLSCEENVDDYGAPLEQGGTGYGWDQSYVKEHNGYIVEVDPFNPTDVPRKHTAMGRFRHENAAVMVSPTGRVVVYMGDDKTDACVFKFVTTGAYDPRNREANLRLLESGKLYAADFQNGKWVLLDYDTQSALKSAKKADGSPRFKSQADVLADATGAAIVLRATPTDRPEDIEVHPRTGQVYIAMTNNANHSNYHGQIVRLTETSNNPEAETFEWEFFAVGGPQSGFSSPDNLVFDPYGNLWMVTDISSSRTGKGIYKFQGNNAMFFFATEGANAGKAVQFASGPVECELTGPFWTPDGRTMFVAIQHPGEESTSRDKLTSHWPNLNGDPMPRPGVVAITGFPGWARGSRFLPF
ncbi:MAG TPA: PhoX family phosphatase [Herpetosiphonaceae bacterium]